METLATAGVSSRPGAGQLAADPSLDPSPPSLTAPMATVWPMGSMREKRPGVWELRVYVGRVDGKKKWAHRTFEGGERAASKALSSFETQISGGTINPTEHCTINQLLDQYIASRAHRWSPNTRRDQPAAADRWIRPAIGAVDIARIRPRDIEQLVDRIAIDHPSTARKVLAILRSAFEDAVRWDLVIRNPARSARRPQKPPAKTTSPSLELVRAAIAQADPAMALIVRLAVVTGCRRGELLALQWADIDLLSGSVAVSRAVVEAAGRTETKGTKTGRVKVLALDAATISALRSWRARCVEESLAFGVQVQGDHFLFARRPDGREPWNPSTLSHKWRVLADANDLTGVRFHDLRHATATTLISAGVDPKTAANRLGHDPSVMLSIYTHAVPAHDQAAAEVMATALDG